jgi:HrpA-like RNA helicase
MAGYDATELPFFHSLDAAVIADAKRSLHALGAMDENSAVTRIGKFMARLPVSVQYARMIVEAERLGVMDDVLTIVAILEQGSIRARDGKWTSLTQEKESDLLAELDVWHAAEGMSGQVMRESGIFAPAFFKAKDLRRKLLGVLPSSMRYCNNPKCTRRDVLVACVAGMVDHLYRSEGSGSYRNGGSTSRQLAKESVVSGGAEWVTAKPFTISGKNARGRPFMINLITQVTKVDPTWLVEIAPQLVKIEKGLSPAYDPNQDACVSTSRTHFNGQQVKEERVATPDHEAASQEFAKWLAGQMVG